MEKPIYEVRASAFGGVFDCALKFSKEQLEGLKMPNNPRALIGTGVHAGTAAFDKAKLEGGTVSVSDAAGATADAIAERIATEGVRWYDGEPTRREVDSIANRLTINYCREISPRYEFASVELTTKPMDIDCGQIIIRLKGTLDRSRVVKVPTAQGMKRRIADLKTGRSAVAANGKVVTAKHRPQLGTYILLDEHTTGEAVDDTSEIIGMNTTGRFATGIGEVHGARQLLLGTEHAPGLIELAAMMFKSGLFPPNPQSFLCSERYCANWNNCPYANR